MTLFSQNSSQRSYSDPSGDKILVEPHPLKASYGQEVDSIWPKQLTEDSRLKIDQNGTVRANNGHQAATISQEQTKDDQYY